MRRSPLPCRSFRRATAWRPVALLLLALPLAAGCALLRYARFKEPIVALQNVRLVGLGLEGGELDVVLSVYNPNDFSLDATRLTYRVEVEETTVGEGELDALFSVAKQDSARVRLPVRFTYRGLGAAGAQLMRTGSVEYRVRGDLGVKSPVGDFTRPYDRRGRFNAEGTR